MDFLLLKIAEQVGEFYNRTKNSFLDWFYSDAKVQGEDDELYDDEAQGISDLEHSTKYLYS